MRIRTSLDITEALSVFKNITHYQDNMPWNSIAAVATASIETNFKVGGRYGSQPGGGGRAKWRPRKVDSFTKLGNADVTWPILSKSGRMRDSIMKESLNKGSKAEQGVMIKTQNIVYAAVHQYGYAKRNIPKRPFMVVQNKDVSDMTDILDEHLQKAVDKPAV